MLCYFNFLHLPRFLVSLFLFFFSSSCCSEHSHMQDGFTFTVSSENGLNVQNVCELLNHVHIVHMDTAYSQQNLKNGPSLLQYTSKLQ